MTISEIHRRVEKEPKRKVLVTFSGRLHSPFNLQGVDNSIFHLTRHLGQSSGRGILLMENAMGTATQAEKIKKKVSAYGGYTNIIVATVLQVEGEKEPSQQMIDLRRSQIDGNDLESILRDGLLHPTFLAEYYLYRELDRLRKEYPFNIQSEVIDPSSINRYRLLSSEAETFSQKAVDHFRRREFAEAVNAQKINLTRKKSAQEIRDNSVVDNMKKTVKKMLRDDDGGSVFILFGSTHSVISDRIRRVLGYDNQVGFGVHLGKMENLIRQVIFRKIINNEPIADIEYLRDIAFGYLSDTLQQYAIDKKRIPEYARHYETLHLDVINTIVSDLSEEEMKEVAKKDDEAIVEFIKVNPLSEPVRHFLE